MSESNAFRSNRLRNSKVATVLAAVVVSSACTSPEAPVFPDPVFSKIHDVSSKAWDLLQHPPLGAEVSNAFGGQYKDVTGTLEGQKWTVQLSSFGTNNIKGGDNISDVHISWGDTTKPPSELRIIQDHPDDQDPMVSTVEAVVTRTGDLAIIESGIGAQSGNTSSVDFQQAKCMDTYQNQPPRNNAIAQALLQGAADALDDLEHGVVPTPPIVTIVPQPGDSVSCTPGL